MGAVFIDEMHNLHDPDIVQGAIPRTAIIETLLPFMENHRDDLRGVRGWLSDGDGADVTANQACAAGSARPSF